jgi:hypothetical protein
MFAYESHTSFLFSYVISYLSMSYERTGTQRMTILFFIENYAMHTKKRKST